ncbi:hypothetical protein HDV05_004432 [Chytridiales sp. JEL 0842]|nr:hypothetical protein HDV05_004432 [Chytridiales sp. JEL 0842]
MAMQVEAPVYVPHLRMPNTNSVIVLGDESVFCGNNQFSSTMKIHFKKHPKVEIEGVEKKKAAGRPLGMKGSTREVHVVFGDYNKHQPERLQSVTAQEYITHPTTYNSRGMHPESTTGREKWETKNELMMNAAHVGIKTKHDLPCDEKRFNSFQTTNQGAYAFNNKEPLPAVERFDKKPRTRASIPWGDSDKQRSYDTIAASTYIQHPTETYQDHQTTLKHPPTSKHAILSITGEPHLYATTNHSTYRAIDTHRVKTQIDAMAEKIAKDRSRGYIIFGEDTDSKAKEVYKAQFRPTQSVTQKDFKLISEKERREVNSAPPQRHRTIPVGSGIALAMCPDKRPTDDVDTRIIPIEPQQAKIDPSDTPRGVIPTWQRNLQKSSIPTGDARWYKFENFDTTASSSYYHHCDAETPTFPIRGANITKTSFSFSDGFTSDSAAATYRSTTASTFVDHGERERVQKIRPVSMGATGAINGEYPMCNNNTTNTEIYKAPTHDIRPVLAKAPECAPSILFFPLNAKIASTEYETTTGAFFNKRQELYALKNGSNTSLSRQNKARESSIPFGDRRHFNTK